MLALRTGMGRWESPSCRGSRLAPVLGSRLSWSLPWSHTRPWSLPGLPEPAGMQPGPLQQGWAWGRDPWQGPRQLHSSHLLPGSSSCLLTGIPPYPLPSLIRQPPAERVPGAWQCPNPRSIPPGTSCPGSPMSTASGRTTFGKHGTNQQLISLLSILLLGLGMPRDTPGRIPSPISIPGHGGDG